MKLSIKQWMLSIAIFAVLLYGVFRFGQTVSAEWATFAATTAGVIVNVLFLWALLRQIKTGDRAAELAQNAVEESRKTRLDESAPRVTVLLDKPMAIKLTNPDEETRGATYSSGDSQPFHRPDDDVYKSSIGCMGTIKNEGDYTVRVLLNGPATFIGEEEDDDNMGIPFARDGNEDEERMLAPGDTVGFSWYQEIPVRQLIDTATSPQNQNPGASSFLTVVASRPSADGIFDQFILKLSSFLVERVPGSDSLWRYRSEQEVRLVNNQFKRLYSRAVRYWLITGPPASTVVRASESTTVS